MAVDTMMNSTRWDSIFVPAIINEASGEDGGDGMSSPAGERAAAVSASRENIPQIKKLNKSASLRNLAKKWSTGKYYLPFVFYSSLIIYCLVISFTVFSSFSILRLLSSSIFISLHLFPFLYCVRCGC
jgi:hypothetical protein